MKTTNNTKKHFAGFTLVELIVVITILVILGTIAFTSLGGYSGSARDSSRVSDITNLSKTLEIAYIKTNVYPSPDGYFTVTYSGGSLWQQGTIGDTVMTQLNSAGGIKMNKKPTDPLSTTKEYTYSKLSYGKAHQLKADYEGDSIAYNPILIPEAQAASGNPAISYIKGNYNGVAAKTQTGGLIYLFAIPGIITGTGSTGGTLKVETNDLSGTLLIHGISNTIGVNFNPKIVYFSGALPSTDAERILFASGIAGAYSGTTLATNPQIKTFINATSNTGTLSALGGDIVSGSLGGSASVTTSTPTVTTTFSLSATSVTTGTPVTITDTCSTHPTSYTSSTTSVATISSTTITTLIAGTTTITPVGGNCTDSVGKVLTVTAPPLITSTNCTSANWYWVTPAQDVYIGTTQGNGYCISPRIGDFPGDSTGNGISWNGWGSYSSHADYNGWNTDTVRDSDVPDASYAGQTRDITHIINASTLYTCTTLGSATAGLTKSDNTDSISTADDTIVNRMRYLAKYKSTIASLNAINWISANAKPSGQNTFGALQLSDCIDGTRDLGATMSYTHGTDSTVNTSTTDTSTTDNVITYTEYSALESVTTSASLSNITYQNRQKYLTAWTQEKGSHLPSAFSSITNGQPGGAATSNNLTGNARGEYQVACVLGKFGTYSALNQNSENDQEAEEYIWLSSIGNIGGSNWGIGARMIGYSGCGVQADDSTSARHGYNSARFVVRP